MTFNRLQPRAPDKEPVEPLVRAEGDSLYADRDRLCLSHHHSSSSDSSRAQAFKSRRTAATPGPGARSAESNRPRLSGRAAAERYRARPDPLAQVAPPDASFGDYGAVGVPAAPSVRRCASPHCAALAFTLGLSVLTEFSRPSRAVARDQRGDSVSGQPATLVRPAKLGS
jgi:hypothetical protein